jgi:uncharacterized protein YjcR
VKTTYRMSYDDVYEIKRLLWVGERQVDVAEKFSLSQSYVSAIKRGKVWRQCDFKPTDEDRKLRTETEEARRVEMTERRRETKRRANQKYAPTRAEINRLGREAFRQQQEQLNRPA